MDLPPPGRARWLVPFVTAALIAGCATKGPSTGGDRSRLPPGNSQRDGPDAHPPADLDKVPDAVPTIEPIRNGGPNKPYDVDGRTYVPITDDRPVVQKGLASWYGKRFHGHRTSSGEAYNMYAMTAAHPTLPIPSYARVRNPANGREVIVRVNDRGPFAPGRIIDLSYTAALKLGVLGGVAPVEVERITSEAIRTGAWMKGGGATTAVAAAPAPAPAPPPRATVSTTTVTTSVGPNPLPIVLPVPLPEAAAATLPPAPAPSSDPTPAAADPAPPPAMVAIAQPSVRLPPDEQNHAYTPAAVGFWVQLGAYKAREGALGFQKQVSEQEPWLAPLLAVYQDRGLHKLQAGPYPTRDEARNAAEKIRTSLQLVPTIVEKK